MRDNILLLYNAGLLPSPVFLWIQYFATLDPSSISDSVANSSFLRIREGALVVEAQARLRPIIGGCHLLGI
jgi:hypothetical protein